MHQFQLGNTLPFQSIIHPYTSCNNDLYYFPDDRERSIFHSCRDSCFYRQLRQLRVLWLRSVFPALLLAHTNYRYCQWQIRPNLLLQIQIHIWQVTNHPALWVHHSKHTEHQIEVLRQKERILKLWHHQLLSL